MKNIKSLSEFINEASSEDLRYYMFFQNLKTIKSCVDEMLSMDPTKIDSILVDGHDWAADHITTSKDDIEEVFGFLKNQM